MPRPLSPRTPVRRQGSLREPNSKPAEPDASKLVTTGKCLSSPHSLHLTPVCVVRVKPSTSTSLVVKGGNSVVVSHAGKRKIFGCQHVLPEDVSNEGVWSHVSSAVGPFILGYNVSVIAYGAGGSGKTYTLGNNRGPDFGLIPRTARALFQELTSSLSSKNNRTVSLGTPASIANTRQIATQIPRFSSTRIGRPQGHYRHNSAPSITINPWTVTVSYLEIVNEQLRDLLSPASNANLFITEDGQGNIGVSGLREIVVETADHLLVVLDKGSSARQTSSTSTSRSHAIFTIRLAQKQFKQPTGIVTTITSKLNFVDLAPSNGLSTSTAPSHNSGLASLVRVLSQISTQPKSQVSFQDTNLTRILQDSIGGRAITHVIACVSKDPVPETINTLSFAQQISGQTPGPEADNNAELVSAIQQLQEEIKSLKLAQQESPSITTPTSRRPSSTTSSPVSSDFDLSRELTDSTEFSVETCKERIGRSQEFHEAVETVIADYEKTIGTLQSSLLESRVVIKETQNKLEVKSMELASKSLELEEFQANHLELVEIAESMERKLNTVMQEQAIDRQRFEDQLKIAETKSMTQSPSTLSPSIQRTMSRSSSGSGRRSSHTSASDLPLEAELYLVKEELKSCQLELKGLRAEHKAFSSESQYLTSRYNQTRREADALKEENQALKDQIAALLKNPAPALASNDAMNVSTR